MRNDLLGEQERVRLRPVAADEKPAAKSRLGGVEVVANRQLGDLSEQPVHVPEQALFKLPARDQCLLELIGFNPQSFAGDLNPGLVRNDVGTQQEGYTDHSLVADHGYLDGVAFAGAGEERDHPTHREVGITNGFSKFVENLTPGELNIFRVRKQPFQFILKKAVQQSIACRTPRCCGDGHEEIQSFPDSISEKESRNESSSKKRGRGRTALLRGATRMFT